jgi:hypothetical protein
MIMNDTLVAIAALLAAEAARDDERGVGQDLPRPRFRSQISAPRPRPRQD